MRTLTIPVVLFLSVITLSCHETPQPLAVDSAAPTAQLMSHEFTGNIANDGQNHVGEVVVITDPTPSSIVWCGFTFLEYDAVIIDAGEGAIITEFASNPSDGVLQPGDRFEITVQTECFHNAPGDRLELTLERITSRP